MSTFEILNGINVNGHTEQKNGLTYLSWAWAWGELLKRFPDSTYTVYENAAGWNYHTDGRTAWVKTGVTVEGKEYVEFLPVMDFKNRSIPLEQITSFDVNKAIQRSLTKAVARHGLGLYIYAGEDLPEDEAEAIKAAAAKKKTDNGGDAVPKAAPAQATHARIAAEWCRAQGISPEAFGNHLKIAQQNGAVPDKKLNDMSDDEFNAVLKWVAANNG